MSICHIRGKKKEAFISKNFHANGIPVLINPDILRKNNCGQADLIRLIEYEGTSFIEICEVKVDRTITRFQQQRLYNTARFLSSIFNLPIKFKFELGQFNKNLCHFV